jgi:hypothetical protein
MALQTDTINSLSKAGAAIAGGDLSFRNLAISLIEDFNALLAELAYLREQIPDPDTVSAGTPADVVTSLGISTNEVKVTSLDIAALARAITESLRRVCLELAETAMILNDVYLLTDSLFSGTDYGHVIRTGNDTYKIASANIIGTSNPSATNDVTGGWDQLSVAFNTTLKNIFMCMDATLNNAVWRRLSPPQTSFCFFAGEAISF